MFRRVLPGVVLALAVIVPGLALAGGHVDIKVVSVPQEFQVGRATPVTFTVTFPGGEPCPLVKPVVRVRSGRSQRDFAAVAAKTPGTFLANVKLPREGEWSMMLDAGYCQNRLELEPVTAVTTLASKR